MKGLCKLALVALVVAACGGDVGITEPVAPTALPPVSGGILALGVDSTTGASIETNKDDYAPGEVVHVVGRGWAPGETVNLHMTEEPNTHADVDTSVVADASGGFSIHYYDVQAHDIGVTFTLAATGGTSGSRAVATFTDRNFRLAHSGGVANFTGASAMWTSSSSCSGSADFDYAVGAGGSGTVTDNHSSSYARAAVLNQSLRFRVPKSVGAYTFGSWAYGNATTSGSESSDATFAYSKCVQGEASSGASNLTATYIPPNQAPDLNNITNKTVDEGTAVTFNANASDDALPDPPGALSFSLGTPSCANPVPTAGLGAASINPSTGQFSWPTNEATNATTTTFCARIIVSDGALTDQQDVNITVNELNSAPVLTVPSSFSANAGAAIPSGAATVVDSDDPANTHTFSKVSGPSWVTVAANGTITYGATTSGDAGAHTVTIKVDDNGSPVMSDQESYTVTIIALNQAPVLDAIANPTVNEGTTVSVDADASDDGLPTPPGMLTFSFGTPACPNPVPTGVGGASIHSLTGQFSWPTNETTNATTTTFCARIVVSDGTLTDHQDITITVNELNVAPVLDAIGNKSVNEGSLLTFDADATDDDIPANTLTYSLDAGAPAGATINSSTGVFTWTPTNGPSQSASITVRVTDNGASAMSDFETITVTVNNVAPQLSLGAATATLNEGGTFSRSGSFTDPGTDTWAATVNYGDGGGNQTLTLNADKTFSLSKLYAQDGSYTVTVSIDDGDAGSDSEIITVTVDNVLPVVSAFAGATINEGQTYSTSGSFTDPGADTWTATVNYGDGSGVQTLALSGKNFTLSHTYADDDGSPFTVTVTVTDDDGNGVGTATVIVSNVPPTITAITTPIAPVAAGTNNVTVTWDFTDPGTDTWTCSIQWDVGQSFESANYVNPKSCSATKTLTPGLYTVTVKVADDDGGEGSETVQAYIVVYDPNGGFVTGGGWINSLPGFYRLNVSAQGKANFGFVSKYLPGKNVPTGNTEFQFHAGDLNFKSTVYEWLVVAGTKAMYKGEGTIAGRTGVYGFLLSAIDASPDKFRIKIWDMGSGDVVYDTLPEGAADDADPSTTLGGGSIVVHTKK